MLAPLQVPVWFNRRNRRFFVTGVALMFSLALVAAVTPRIYAAVRASPLTYTAANVPPRPVAIVFGALIYANGRPSAMLADRVAMAADLYKAGKVQAILLTGDNHIDSYNEPEAMRQYALGLGVPDSALVLDYAGFRTYDSCYRARDIFGVSRAILVTQAFHLDRALLTCNALGVESVGVSVDVLRPDGYSRRSLLISETREFASTAMTLIDLAFGRKPRYLGEPLPIFTSRK